MDSGSGFFLLWLVTSANILYSFLLSVVFTLIRLCTKSHILYLSIVRNPFCSLLYAFQCGLPCNWSFLFLFFIVCLCFFRSYCTPGFLCLLVIVIVLAGAIFSMVFSISLLSWLAAISSVVPSRIGRLLNSFLIWMIASSVNFCSYLFLFWFRLFVERF